MDLANAQDACRNLVQNGGAVDIDATMSCRRLAAAFLAALAAGTDPDWSDIDLLCRMAADPRFERVGLQALYDGIVLPLCDDFTAAGVDAANRVLVRIIDFVRHTPQGQEMAAMLDRLGFSSSEALLERYHRLTGTLPDLQGRRIKKVLVLSRVTVGADVVITSVIVRRLLQALPAAEVVVVGPAHLDQIFHGLERVRWRELAYDRAAALVERITVWEPLRRVVDEEGAGLGAGEFLLVDPDSRLAQLGLLPLAADADTCYFPSRVNPWAGQNPSLTELVNGWLDRLLGKAPRQSPVVSLPTASAEAARTFCHHLRAGGCRFVVVINFGVGGDRNKRLGDPFETKLIPALLDRLADTVILLDSGCACEEKERVRLLLADYRERAIATDFVDENSLAGKKIGFAHGVVGFRGSVAGVAGLIDSADAFFGYDSCCQHLAGALNTPSVIAFVGASNPRFAARWRPYDATGHSAVIPFSGRPIPAEPVLAALTEQVATAMANIRAKENNS